MSKIHFSFVFFFLVFIIGCTKDQTSSTNIDCSSISSKFSSDINPILASSKCSNSRCHGSSVASVVGYSNIIQHVNDGHFASYVINRTGKPMPPDGETQLTVDELNKFKCWKQNSYPNN